MSKLTLGKASTIRDGDGNPLSSHYNPVTDEHILDIHDADVHNRAVNKYVHQHTVTNTTISTASSPNDYQLIVADTTGFLQGDSIHINTGSVEATHPTIVNVPTGAPGTLVLDRRLDKAHGIGDTITRVIIDLSSQVGTLASPQEYFAGPEDGEVWHIQNLTLAMGHNSAGDLGKFGNIDALTNGILLRVKINGVYGTLTNWKSNGDIDVDTGEVRFYSRSGGQGTYGTSTNGAFKQRTGAIMRLDAATGDRFETYVQDDLTTGAPDIAFINMKVQGHIEDY